MAYQIDINQLDKLKFIAVGDSHSSLFSGINKIQPKYPEPSTSIFNCFSTVHLGPILAYSLKSENTTNQGREKLLQAITEIKNANSPNTFIILCFGEIDCRFHLLKKSEELNESIETIVYNCVKRYVSVIEETLLPIHPNIMVWAAVPTADVDIRNEDFPHFGTYKDRVRCTNIFNQMLQLECNKINVTFLSISDKLVKHNNKVPSYYYFDDIHLSNTTVHYIAKKLISIEPVFKTNLELKKIASYSYQYNRLIKSLTKIYYEKYFNKTRA
jgi:lysophospholipase L1-like esterase